MVTVFVNKLLLNSETFNLDAPLFVTWSQCVVSTAICYGMGRLSKYKPGLVSFPSGNPLDARTIKNVSVAYFDDTCHVKFWLLLLFLSERESENDDDDDCSCMDEWKVCFLISRQVTYSL